MPKNYYIILGIPENSTLSDIKAAYRRLAKQYHPDLSIANHTRFPMIHEAYTVLSDPARRSSYDRSLHGKIRIEDQRRRESFHSHAGERIEPLIPSRQPEERGVTSLDTSIHQYLSAFDGLFDRMLTNFTEHRPAAGVRLRDMTVEVLLTPEQARKGGNVRLNVPVQLRCPSCAGTTGGAYPGCWRCNGSGYLTGERQMLVNYPAGITTNHTVQLALSPYGSRDRHLTAVFMVQERR